MVFSSLLFVFLFFSVTMILYYLIPGIKGKNIELLLASMIFYAWGGPSFLLILLAMTFFAWIFAKKIADVDRKFLNVKRQKESTRIQNYKIREKKKWLTIGCICMLLILGVFKYTGFFLGNIQFLFGVPKEIPNIVLPIGISFYTFQLLSYVVDVYRGDVEVQKSYFKLLLYSSLFHQCIAGPIVRYKTVADEIENRKINWTDVSYGVRRFSIGLAKKAILANACAGVCDNIFTNTAGVASASLWIGMLAYTFQIYFDFSAYSDMAIGMGRMAGFHYDENFDYPYVSRSVQEFWRRWHISLGSFFRDYVYIPLGGSRGGNLLTIRNLFAVWFLTGMWHGASWNYILWGLYYLVFLLLERYVIRGFIKKGPSFLLRIYTFIVIYFGWILFRFESLSDVWSVVSGLFGYNRSAFLDLSSISIFKNNMFLLAFCFAAATPLGRWIRQKLRNAAVNGNKAAAIISVLDAFLPALLLILALCALVGNSYNPFIYFQF